MDSSCFRSIFFYEDYMYASGYGSFAVINVSDVNNLDKPIYQFKAFEGNVSINKIVKVGNYMFMAASKSGLLIYDETSKKTYGIVAGSYVNDVFVDGNYAYVNSAGAEFVIIDISKKDEPKVIIRYGDGFGNNYIKIYVKDNYLYTPFTIYDISDKENPKELSRFPSSYVYDAFYVDGNYMYIIDNFKKFAIYDISDKTNPKLISKSEEDIVGDNLEISENYAYLLYGNGITVFDISNKKSPNKIAEFKCEIGVVSSIYIDNSNKKIYAVGKPGVFRTLDISDISNISVDEIIPFSALRIFVW